MLKHVSVAALGAVTALSMSLAPVAAQEGGTFGLELNNAQSADNGCRLTFVASNGLGADLTSISYDVAVFDGNGVVDRLLLLEFGALTSDKRKVVQFVFDLACDNISQLLVNEVADCTAADGTSPDCLSALQTSSKNDIAFGL